MKLIVPLSGGKDSQATLLYCIEKYGVENLTAVFCDTKWEDDLTYSHLDYLVKKTGVKYVILSSEKYGGFLELAKKKKRFPSAKARFCTEKLKVEPMIDFVLDQKDNLIIFQGIRKDESAARSEMSGECRFFRFYFEPYQSNEMIIKKFEANPPKTLAQKNKLKKAQDRLKTGKKDEKFHTYREKEVFAWCEKYADDIRRPFIDATAEDVIYYSLNREVDINPLYFRGASRVGCFPCVLANQEDMKLIIKEFPETITKLKDAEEYVGRTFFAPNYIPKRYHTGKDENGKTFARMEDVVNYLKDKTAQGDLIEDLGLSPTCKSVYSICE